MFRGGGVEIEEDYKKNAVLDWLKLDGTRPGILAQTGGKKRGCKVLHKGKSEGEFLKT